MHQVDEHYPKGWRLAILLTSLFLGTFLVAIDTTIVSVVIPRISTQFHSLNDVGWYGSAYLITMTALQPAGGTIYKLFNVKAVYLISMVVFEGICPFVLSIFFGDAVYSSLSHINLQIPLYSYGIYSLGAKRY